VVPGDLEKNQSKWSTTLGASLPENGNRPSFGNVMLLLKN
jgi:hypothetical protein